MHLAEFNIILSSCIYFTTGFGLHGLGKGYNFLVQKINSSMAVFDSSSITTEWFNQPLDHFNGSETRVWKMRYFERLDYWKTDGPIFLFINGEAEASEVFLQTGILYELAKETKGAMFLSEHRYYGKSMPFKDLTTDNLRYLSSRQALADNAKLIEEIKAKPKFNSSKVVIVGGSYAGNLAAWMKLMYPNLVDAALASSAPVLAKKDFYEYLENVSDDFEEYGTPNCLDKISDIFNRYDRLFKTSSGIQQLKEDEQICDDTDMTKSENRQLFFLDKSSEFMYEAQYGDPNSIKHYCEEITRTFQVPSSRDEETVLWNQKNNCYDYDFDHMIEAMREVDWITSWTYQTCTEFSYFPSTSSSKQPFTNNIQMELFYKWCSKAFGPEFDENRIEEAVDKTNIMYGGLKPNVTNVVFANGNLDPYHRLGILEDVSYDAPAKIINMASHCRDLFSDKSEDPEELKEARRYIKYLIKKWIGEGEFKKP